MDQPQGFVNPKRPTHVCKLHKSIYGLKQAPRAWFQRLSSLIEDLGFQGSKVDPSLFTYNKKGVRLILLIYVDDIIITGNNMDHLHSLIRKLSTKFAIKDLGPLSYFLGLDAQFTYNGLYITQTK